MSIAGVFDFPNPVNEVSARIVAGVVVVMCLATIVTGAGWLIPVIAYGFLARVLTGPTLSPLGFVTTRFITPRLPLKPRLVPGAPKRFAQGIGAALSISAAIAYFGFGLHLLAMALLAMIVFAASLESFFGFCLGCTIFYALMRRGLVPASICENCARIVPVAPPA